MQAGATWKAERGAKSGLIVRQLKARPVPFGNRCHKTKAKAKTLLACGRVRA